MTVSIASITRAEDERSGSENIFLTNGFGNSPTFIKWGLESTKIPGDYIVALWAFRNMTPTIPSNATIVSAVVRGTAEQTRNGVFTSRMSVREPDGLWDPISTIGQWNLSSKGAMKANVDCHVLNTAAATLADTGPTGGGGLGITLRGNAQSRQLKAGESVTIVGGGTLGFADFVLYRIGAGPTGNVWAEVYSIGGDGKPLALLATSDTRPTSTIISGSFNAFRFTFSGGNQITLSGGQQVAVVIAGDFALASGTIWIRWGAGPVDTYPTGEMTLYGDGLSFDNQHYWLVRDLAEGIPIVGSVVDWVAPDFVLGTEYDSGDLTVPLQAFIDRVAYTEGDPICVQFGRDPATTDSWQGDERSFFSFLNATTPKTRLVVEWTVPPAVSGPIIVDEVGIVFATADDTGIVFAVADDTGIAHAVTDDTGIAHAVTDDTGVP